jgi:plasmid stabilization system protein ParE
MRAGLGHDFILNLEAGFDEILIDPYKFKVEYKAVRKHLIKRFPFKIVYIIEDQKVIIIGVLHGKRNPEIIKDRT